MIDASRKIKSAARSKLYNDDYKEYLNENKAGDKIASAIKRKLYSDQLQQVQAVRKTLEPMVKRNVSAKKYIAARDRYFNKKVGNKLDSLEAQTGYIEKVLKVAGEIQKQMKTIN